MNVKNWKKVVFLERVVALVTRDLNREITPSIKSEKEVSEA